MLQATQYFVSQPASYSLRLSARILFSSGGEDVGIIRSDHGICSPLVSTESWTSAKSKEPLADSSTGLSEAEDLHSFEAGPRSWKLEEVDEG